MHSLHVGEIRRRQTRMVNARPCRKPSRDFYREKPRSRDRGIPLRPCADKQAPGEPEYFLSLFLLLSLLPQSRNARADGRIVIRCANHVAVRVTALHRRSLRRTWLNAAIGVQCEARAYIYMYAHMYARFPLPPHDGTWNENPAVSPEPIGSAGEKRKKRKGKKKKKKRRVCIKIRRCQATACDKELSVSRIAKDVCRAIMHKAAYLLSFISTRRGKKRHT